MEKLYGEYGLDLQVLARLRNTLGEPFNLTGKTVYYKLYDPTGAEVYSGTMNILDPVAGIVEAILPAPVLTQPRYTMTIYIDTGSGAILAERISIRMFSPEDISRLYVQPSDVEAWLGIDLSVDEGRIIELILEKMEYIDRMTMTTWNGRVKTYEGYFSWRRPAMLWAWLKGGIVILKHRHIREIQELRVYGGSGGYETVYPGEWRPGRGDGDFWLDSEHGLLYIQHWLFRFEGHEFWIRYTYGSDELPARVSEATKLLVARDLLVNERRYAQLARAEGLDIGRQLEWIDRRLWELLGMLRAPQPTFI